MCPRLRSVYLRKWKRKVREKQRRKSLGTILKIYMVFLETRPEFGLVRYLPHYILFYYEAISFSVFDSFKSEYISG